MDFCLRRYFHIFRNVSERFLNCVLISVVKKQMLEKRRQVLDLTHVLPLDDLGMNSNDPKSQVIGQKMEKFYFGYTKIGIHTISTFLAVSDIFQLFCDYSAFSHSILLPYSISRLSTTITLIILHID